MSTTRPYLRRAGVLGDVHGEDERLARALEFFRAREVDRILAVGDLIDGHGDVEKTLALLEQAGVEAVRGNHERWFLAGQERNLRLATRELSPEAVAYLRGLPATRHYDTPRGGLLLGHGVGEDDMSFLRPETAGYALQDIPALTELMLDPSVQYFVGGHTHVRMVRVFAGIVVVNAGTLFRDDEAVITLLDCENRAVEFHAVDVDAPPRFLERRELPEPVKLTHHEL